MREGDNKLALRDRAEAAGPVIRTMRDDLRLASSTTSPSPKTVAPPKATPSPPPRPPSLPQKIHQPPPPPQLPLPPRPADSKPTRAKPHRVGKQPKQKKVSYQGNIIKFRQRATMWIIIATAIFVIVNTAVATWRYLGSSADSSSAAVPTTADPTTSTLEVFSTEIQGLRSAWLGQMFNSGLIESVALNVQADDSRIKFSGTASLNIEQLPSGVADQQLLSLTPASATFLRLGGNFAEELSTWLATATAADSTTPTITLPDSLRQALHGPYALYATQVDPAPAAPRLSLVIALEADQNIALGNKELEALLLEAAPLLLGQTLMPDQSFQDSSYKETALRFTNSPNGTGAIDYTLLPGYLLISTAKDNMLELMDVYSGDGPSLASDSAAGELLEQWGAPPAGANLIIGYVAPLLDPDAVGADQIATSYLAGLAISPGELPGQAIIEGLLVPQEDSATE